MSLDERDIEGWSVYALAGFSNPCKWRGSAGFIEEKSQDFLEKPQERAKASQRSLTKKVKLLEEARTNGSSFLKKLDKRVKLL